MKKKEFSYEVLVFQGVTGTCVFVALADFIGLLDNLKWLSVRVPSIMLLLLCAIAIYLLYERRGKLNTLEDLARNIPQEISKEIKNSHDAIFNLVENSSDSISNLVKDGGTSLYNSPEETYKYFIERIKKAHTSIDVTHFGGRPYREGEENKIYGRDGYYQTLEEIIKDGKIKVRRIQLVRDRDSFEWMKGEVNKYRQSSFLLGCYVGDALRIPQLSVMVIDGEEFCLACVEPKFSWDQKTISIKNRIFSGMMKNYIDILWRDSHIIKEREVDEVMLRKIESQLNARNLY
jgi:hypothetical protein